MSFWSGFFFPICFIIMDLTRPESPIPSSMPQRSNRDTGCWERGGTATLVRVAVALELRSACLRPDGSCMAGDLQLLSWELDSDNQRVVLGNRRHERECVSKIAAHSLSPVNPRFSDSAQQGLWIHYPH